MLSFEVSVAGAALNPGNVNLLAGKGPVRIEVKKLETDTAFLSTLTVPSGDYTSLNLTFANPELTFRNDSGNTLAGCAPGNVCEIKNPSGPLSSNLNGTFTISSGSQAGLLIDLSLSSLLTQTLGVDFGSAGAVSVSQQTMQPEGELEDVDHIDAIISGLGSNQVTLQASDMGNTTVAVDTNTQFEGFDTCSARNFSCLQSGQSVEVDLMLLGAGSFLAKKIELQDQVSGDNDEDLEGIISKIDSPTQFEIAVIDELSSVANVSVGNPITVMLQTSNGSTSFQVDTDGLNVPSNLQQAFESQVDTTQLLPGQTVQVRAMLVSGGPAPAPIM